MYFKRKTLVRTLIFFYAINKKPFNILITSPTIPSKINCIFCAMFNYNHLSPESPHPSLNAQRITKHLCLTAASTLKFSTSTSCSLELFRFLLEHYLRVGVETLKQNSFETKHFSPLNFQRKRFKSKLQGLL